MLAQVDRDVIAKKPAQGAWSKLEATVKAAKEEAAAKKAAAKAGAGKNPTSTK